MGTTIAVISDVHGNSAALRAVLNEIDKNSDIEQIYCIGDMVGIGYETNEVLDLLFSRTDISFVLGNHEEEIMAILEGKEGNSQGREKTHHVWLANRLEKRFIPYIADLPREIIVEFEGKKLLFTHYHSDSKKRFASIDTEPSTKKLESFYENSPFDLICFGHHHTVHHFSSPQRSYLNPGSLGCCDEPIARYAVITIVAGEMNVELKGVYYDNHDFLLGYEILEVPAKEFILQTFHGNQHLKTEQNNKK